MSTFFSPLQRKVLFTAQEWIVDDGTAELEMEQLKEELNNKGPMGARETMFGNAEPEMWAQVSVRVEHLVNMAVNGEEVDNERLEQRSETTVTFLGCLQGPEELRWLVTDIK